MSLLIPMEFLRTLIANIVGESILERKKIVELGENLVANVECRIILQLPVETKLRDRYSMLYMRTMFLKFVKIIVQLRSIFLLQKLISKRMCSVQYDKKLFATMIFNGKQVQFQLDTGATVNFLSVQEYKEISNDQTLAGLSKSNATFCMYNSTAIKPIGKTRLSVRNPKNNRKYSIEFQIVKEENSPVLGAKTIEGMQLMTLNLQNVSTVENSVEGNLTREQVV